MSRFLCLLVTAIILSGCGERPIDNNDLKVHDGERMYRGGVLPSGEPMTAIVAGDVPIVGTQFSCESCHGRSGMGAAEGAFIVPPIAAQFLFSPSPQPRRPAYDRDSLARLLRDGETPSGRVLAPQLMPRYRISDSDVDVLTAYLESLSAGDSPGVDDTTIRFATVVVEGAGGADAVVGVVRRFAEDINRQTRNDSERWDRGYTPESKLPTVFRKWAVEEWVLSGLPSTWSRQLERYYEKTPVFAVVGGRGTGAWGPVNAFCERHKVPCLYPSVDVPERADDDFYSVYFSRGLLLEADLIAAHLADAPVQAVTQLYCDKDHAPAVVALQRSLAETGVEANAVQFPCDEAPPLVPAGAAAVLWLERSQIEALPDAALSGRVYVSSTLLGGDPVNVGVAGEVYAAHPFRLPGKSDPAFRRFELWAGTRDVELVAPRHQAQAFFACLVINDAVKHMGRFRIREFALDMMDHAEGLGAYVPFYPQPSFGPGQRYINKGGYILPLTGGEPATAEATLITP